jgi:DNA polymerase III subunit delta'
MSDDTEDPRETPWHPRRRTDLKGHGAEEKLLLKSYLSGRMHHAWLLTGRKGIGKATLAYRFARFILAHPDPQVVQASTTLYVPPEAPAARRIAARGHANLLVVERLYVEKDKKLKSEIGVDVARETGAFFGLTAGEAGWRICIVDCADDLNAESANAILKNLEEPPARSLFLLVSHRPGGLLRTIRSRCLSLQLGTLSDEDTLAVLKDLASGEDLRHAATLSGGSPGRALEFIESKGAAQYRRFQEIMAQGRGLTFAQRIHLADAFAGRATATSADEFDSFASLLVGWTGQAARDHALSGKGLAMAEAHDGICHSIRLTNALNLDKRQAVLDALLSIDRAMKSA